MLQPESFLSEDFEIRLMRCPRCLVGLPGAATHFLAAWETRSSSQNPKCDPQPGPWGSGMLGSVGTSLTSCVHSGRPGLSQRHTGHLCACGVRETWREKAHMTFCLLGNPLLENAEVELRNPPFSSFCLALKVFSPHPVFSKLLSF